MDKIRDKISGDSSNDTDYNVALGHMIGEVFADYPYGRTARIIKIYNLGINSIKYPNLICSEVNTNGAVKTLKLKRIERTVLFWTRLIVKAPPLLRQ